MLEETRHDALTVPSAAVQRGPSGVFAYVVKSDDTVEMRPLETGEESGDLTVVTGGLKEGERVTISNAYRLQPGARVSFGAKTAENAPAPAQGGAAKNGDAAP